ncbi:MAG: membrane protein YdbS with pleckstrin-like domain [Phenylobacterium sp.]|jgi:membrane protein YdbS with pleckstrin-like domain
MTTFTNHQLGIDQLPQVDAVTFTALDQKYRWINLTSIVLPWLLPTVGVILLSFILDKDWWIVLLWIGWTILVLLSLVISFLGAKKCCYALREADILYQQGLFWHTTTAVAFKRIQHIDLTHGPLERRYHIATIKCFTAGGAAVDLKIPGLPEEDAQALRSFILEKTTDTTDQSPMPQEQQNDHD